MKFRNSGRVQDKILNRLERQEKQKAFERDRFFRFKLREIHNRLSQKLLMEKVIETERPGAVSEEILRGLKKALRSSEFDFNYFVAPIRNLVPHPNPYALYMTQYILEVLLNDPHVIEIYGTDEEIYRTVDKVLSTIQRQFEQTEEKIIAQLASNKNMVPGSRDYELALDRLLREKVGEPEQ